MATHAYQGVEEFCALTLGLVGTDISLTTCGFETVEENKEQVGSILRREESLYKKKGQDYVWSEAVASGPAVRRHNPEAVILSCVKGTGTGHSARALVGERARL